MREQEKLIPKHGGYRQLKGFQVAQVVYDVTVRFCARYIDAKSRTRDQMVQAARSGVQNIAEVQQGVRDIQENRTQVDQCIRASLEELRLDYEDLRQRRLLPSGRGKIGEGGGLSTADAVAAWARDVRKRGLGGPRGHGGQVSTVHCVQSPPTLKFPPTASWR